MTNRRATRVRASRRDDGPIVFSGNTSSVFYAGAHFAVVSALHSALALSSRFADRNIPQLRDCSVATLCHVHSAALIFVPASLR